MSKLFKNLFEYAEQYKLNQTKSQLKYERNFIKKAKLVHGDKYDYSKVEYIKSSEKVCIICPIHGEFWQTPSNHICGKQDCPQCSNPNKIKLTTEEFIKRAKEVHGDKYDYSLVEYKNINTLVKIICYKHGIFKQKPINHLSGCGCQICNGTGKLSNKTEFIKKATKIHNNKYDYSRVVYKKSQIKVCIICPIHGEFKQRPNDHLNGYGCPICGIETTNYTQGKYIPKYPEKYSGDINKIIYRSSYELKAFQLIEEDKNTIFWSSESVKIPYELNKKLHKYVVDIKLINTDGIKLIEIKPESQTRPPKYDYERYEYHKNMKKWMAAKEYCFKHNCEFQIWTERELGI